jgi:hypothetical protein
VRDVSWTSTRSWPNEEVTDSMMVVPASWLMALVTSSLVSRTAISSSTGMSQARMAARTRPRASPAATGLAVSRMRQTCSSVGRVGAIAFIGILIGRGPNAVLKCSVPVARK